MKKLIILLAVFSIFGCREKAVIQEEPENESSVNLSDSLEVETNRVVTLLPEAQEVVSSWLAYATAQNEINSMKNATGTDLVQVSRPLVQIMETLTSTMPDTLQVPAVITRVNVLVTKANVLHQLSTQKKLEPEEIFDTANDLILEFGNFKIQLNEMYMKTLEDFETELDLEFEEAQDSVKEARNIENEDSLENP